MTIAIIGATGKLGGHTIDALLERGVEASGILAVGRDLAEAAAVVLTTPGHEGAGYELSDDTAWNYAEFAAETQHVLGTPVRYDALMPEQERDMLPGAGLDEGTVGFIGAMNASMREGTQATTSGDLSRLIGRPTTPMIETMKAWR